MAKWTLILLMDFLYNTPDKGKQTNKLHKWKKKTLKGHTAFTVRLCARQITRVYCVQCYKTLKGHTATHPIRVNWNYHQMCQNN